MEPTPDRNVFQRIMARIREGREGESDLSASEMPASMDMDKRGTMDKTKTGVKMPMKPPAARVASPAPRPVTAAPDPVMTAVDQAMPQMGAGRMGSDLRPAATTPAAPPAAPKGPGTAPSMSQPQKWEGKGGYFYDYKPSKGTKGTPGYRPATITMHGGRYNNTAGTTIDEEHIHFDGIIAELKALGDDRGPFMSLTQYQQQQAAQGNRASMNNVLNAVGRELTPEPEPAPVPEPEPAPVSEPAPAPAPMSGLPRPLPGAGVSFLADETPSSPTDMDRLRAASRGQAPPSVEGRRLESSVSDVLAGLTSIGSGVSLSESRQELQNAQRRRREQEQALRVLNARPDIKELHMRSLIALQSGDLNGAFEAASQAMRLSPEVTPIMLPILRSTQR
tara:strand:+ start:172 stop:1347 length:1176 start_codon:yes stop_codon:yes gene_type:complete